VPYVSPPDLSCGWFAAQTTALTCQFASFAATAGILLRTLCDRINRIGEIGYFLASFEAAITHIQEIDLTEDKEEMLSFLTVPLTEIELDDAVP
jgi:hypothetical protein